MRRPLRSYSLRFKLWRSSSVPTPRAAVAAQAARNSGTNHFPTMPDDEDEEDDPLVAAAGVSVEAAIALRSSAGSWSSGVPLRGMACQDA